MPLDSCFYAFFATCEKQSAVFPLTVSIPLMGSLTNFKLWTGTELRLMVYKYLLCFEVINFGKHVYRRDVQLHRSRVWLQHNPRDNPLVIMSVSRQVYDEAQRIFYISNMFTFESFDGLPVFLIGIGPENAILLRAVWCKKKEISMKEKSMASDNV